MAGDKHKYNGQEDAREGSIVMLAHLKPAQNALGPIQPIKIQLNSRTGQNLCYVNQHVLDSKQAWYLAFTFPSTTFKTCIYTQYDRRRQGKHQLNASQTPSNLALLQWAINPS